MGEIRAVAAAWFPRCAVAWCLLPVLGCGEPAPDPCGPVAPSIAGSALPVALTACHYDRALSESSISLSGPASTTIGGIAIWVERSAFADVDVGVTLAGVPNVDRVRFGVAAPVTLHVEEVAGAHGEPRAREGELGRRDAPRDALTMEGGVGAGPRGSHSLFVRVAPLRGARAETLHGKRNVELASRDADVRRVRGELVLELPLGVRVAELEVGGAAVDIGGLRATAVRVGGHVSLELTGASERFAGVEPVGRRGFVEMERCEERRTPASIGEGRRELSCDWEIEPERVRVAIAESVLERRFPFDLALAAE